MTEGKRKIRSFVLRQAKESDAQKRAYEQYFLQYALTWEQAQEKLGTQLAASASGDFARAIFGNDKPVVLEIGFGMGHATAEIAISRPETNFLGIEVHRPGVGALLARIAAQQISNLRIIHADAVEVLRSLVPPASLAGIHLFFPDPWPKKRHWKRRIFNVEFLALCARACSPGAYLYAATDWEPYAEWMLEQAAGSPDWENPAGGYAPKQEWRPQTSFERKGLESGRDIKELLFRRT